MEFEWGCSEVIVGVWGYGGCSRIVRIWGVKEEL